MLLWAQKVLDSKKVSYPKITNLQTMELIESSTSDGTSTEKRGEKDPPSQN
jgi:hypothetical protein